MGGVFDFSVGRGHVRRGSRLTRSAFGGLEARGFPGTFSALVVGENEGGTVSGSSLGEDGGDAARRERDRDGGGPNVISGTVADDSITRLGSDDSLAGDLSLCGAGGETIGLPMAPVMIWSTGAGR